MTAPTSLRERWFARVCDPSDKVLAIFLLAPAFCLLALIVAYPIGRLIWNSFFDMQLSGGEDAVSFVGWQNYKDLLEDPDFWNAAYNTLLITVITVPGGLVVGLGLALLANLPFRRRWPVRLALLLPWALPLSFVGLIFAWFLHTDFGIVNDVARRLGAESPTMWLLSPRLGFAAICAAIIWKTSSFIALILLAGLQMIPRSLYEAAEVDGASRWQQFWQITIPMLMPSIIVALIFRTITALQTFDIPFTMTRGGPGNATETLAMLIHKTTIDYLDVGYGSTQAVAMFVLSLLVTAFYLRRIGKE